MVFVATGQPADGVAGRDFLRNFSDPSGDDGVRNGLCCPRSRLHRVDAEPPRCNARADDPLGLDAAPLHADAKLDLERLPCSKLAVGDVKIFRDYDRT